MINFIKRLLGPWWLGGEKPEPMTQQEAQHQKNQFYSRALHHQIQAASVVYGDKPVMIRVTDEGGAAQKNERLAYLARQADRIKDQIAKARQQKKARRGLYRALEAVMAERLRVENS